MLIVSPDAGRLEALRVAALNSTAPPSVSTRHGSLTANGSASFQGITDILFVDGTSSAMEELDALEALQRANAGMKVVFLAPSDDSKILLRALRAGVREVLTPDTIESELPTALERLRDEATASGSSGSKVFVFVGCKGGGGTTFLAANFAYNIAEKTAKKVLLMDLDLRGGNAHLMLSARKPLVTIADLAREIHRVDSSFLHSSMIDILPNLGVMAAPEDPAQANEVRATHLETIIGLARKDFDFLVIDIGRSIAPFSVSALDAADIVFPVMQLSVPFIREARRLIVSLRGLDYLPERIKPLVNRHEKVKNLRVEDLERAIGTSVHALLPNDYGAAADAANQGEPVAKLAKSSAINKAINKLVEEFAMERTTSSGWFSRVLGR